MIKYNPEIHHRRSVRLKNYDYSQPGAYFVTINTYQRDLLLGNIANGLMSQNEYGKIVYSCWEELPDHYLHVKLDSCMIMPNLVHTIIFLVEDVGAGLKPALTNDGLKPKSTDTKRHPLSEIVRSFKTFLLAA